MCHSISLWLWPEVTTTLHRIKKNAIISNKMGGKENKEKASKRIKVGPVLKSRAEESLTLKESITKVATYLPTAGITPGRLVGN